MARASLVLLLVALAASVAVVTADSPCFYGAYAYNAAGPTPMTLVRTQRTDQIDTFDTTIQLESQTHFMAYDFVSRIIYVIDQPSSGGTRVHRIPLQFSGWTYDPVLANATKFEFANQTLALHFDVNTGLLNGVTRDGNNKLFTVIVNPFVGKVTFTRPFTWTGYQPDDIVHSSWNPNNQQMLLHSESQNNGVTTVQWRNGVTNDIASSCVGLEGAWHNPYNTDFVAIVTNNTQPQIRCVAKIMTAAFGQCQVLDCANAPSDQPFRGAGMTRCTDSCQFLGVFVGNGKLWRVNNDGSVSRWGNDGPDTRWMGRGGVFIYVN